MNTIDKVAKINKINPEVGRELLIIQKQAVNSKERALFLDAVLEAEPLLQFKTKKWFNKAKFQAIVDNFNDLEISQVQRKGSVAAVLDTAILQQLFRVAN